MNDLSKILKKDFKDHTDFIKGSRKLLKRSLMLWRDQERNDRKRNRKKS
jgi:transposase